MRLSLQVVVQVAEPRRLPETLGIELDRGAEPVQEQDAALESGQRIVRVHLKGLGQRRRLQRSQRRAIRAQRLRQMAREQAALEQREAGERQPLGAGERLAARRLAPAPALARAGVEQHARKHEIEADARALVPIDPVELGLALPPAVARADCELPPATVQRDLEIRIVLARNAGDEFGGHIQPSVIDREVRRQTGFSRGEHHGRPRAHGFRRPEPAHRCLEVALLAGRRDHRWS